MCGEVQFALNVDRISMYQCQCEECRKQSGTASSCGTVVKEAKFNWLSGENSVRAWEKESGFSSHFCSHCGSSTPNKFRNEPFYWVPVGSLDCQNVVTTANLFTCEKANWSNVDSGTNPYDTKPTIEHLVQLLANEGTNNEV